MSRKIGSALGLAWVLTTATAHAEPVSPTGKGIAGGALLGAELVVITESLVGIENGWWYLLGGTLGAGGGGVGGYFVEQSAGADLSLFMLVGGMALVIPASIAYLNATSYTSTIEDEAPSDAPSPGIESEFGRVVPELPAPSLVRLDEGALNWGVPDVRISEVYSQGERLELGVAQHTQVLVPVFAGRF